MPVVVATDLHKAFGSRPVLEGVSCSIHADERIGVVGINGSGKSTLGRILAGQIPPDRGTVARRRGAHVAFLEQDPSFAPELTPREIVRAGLGEWSEARARHQALADRIHVGDGDVESLAAEQAEAAADVERLGGWDMDHRIEAILDHLGVTAKEAPMGTQSGGMRRRVALAQILVSRPALAVLDEPSNHLDVETIAWLETYLANDHPGAILLITHDRYLLDRVANRTWEIDQGQLFAYEGGYEAYLEAKAERLALVARTEANRQNLLRRELEWLRRQPKARTGKQKARIQRAEQAQANEPVRTERALSLSLESSATGGTLVSFRKASVDLGGRRLVSRFDTTVLKGERIGIIGRNGAGKTSLLRAMFGEIPTSEGEIVLAPTTRVAYLSQGRDSLDHEASVYENVAKGRAKIDFGGKTLDIRGYLERFLFDGRAQEKPVAALSGGEKARVALAKLLAEPANLIVLDEPTNDLDVATLGALEEMLVEHAGAALIVTHDRWFLNRVATGIFSFEGEPQGAVVRYAGGFDDWLLQRRAAEQAREAEKPERSREAEKQRSQERASSRPANKPKSGLTWAEQKELDGLLDRIEQAESRVAALEKDLSDPAIYATRAAEVGQIVSSLDAAKVEVQTLTDRWEALESKKTAG